MTETQIIALQTARLTLRQWKNSDLPIFAALNADPAVMAHYPSTLTREQSDAMANKLIHLINNRGWGLWAIEATDVQQFMGFVGLHIPTYDLPVSPCLEIGWRLAKKYWGYGYATEAAKAAMEFAFTTLQEDTIYSFTSVTNAKSRAVMARLGLHNTHHNFNHPMLPDNHILSEHVLYKIQKEQWVSASL